MQYYTVWGIPVTEKDLLYFTAIAHRATQQKKEEESKKKNLTKRWSRRDV